MTIRLRKFKMDKTVVARCIYGTELHRTTNVGVVISENSRWELSEFLRGYNEFVGVQQTPYYRIDAYFDGSTLTILEINASFVDGWGTALNLARASEIAINPSQLTFPKSFTCIEKVYEPELRLFIDELSVLGLSNCLVDFQRSPPVPTYVYGRVGWPNEHNIFPYDGVRLDDKFNLANYDRARNSDVIKVPLHYWARYQTWEEIPTDVVLKFRDKSSPECAQARFSVLIGKPVGKAKFLKGCYASEVLIAQDFIQPTEHEGKNCQIVIMAIGNTPIVGYVQFSDSRIINDDSVHGPLLFE